MSSSSQHHRQSPFLPLRSCSSTAQANLARIITIIVTVPPLQKSSIIGIAVCDEEKDVNLDLRLGISPAMSRRSEIIAVDLEEDGIPTAHSGVVDFPGKTDSGEASTVDKGSEGECSPEATPIKHGSMEISEITNTSCKETASEGYLDLLLEAARQVSGDRWNDEKPSESSPSPQESEPRKRSKRKETAAKMEPIVRSKRGRTQALPLRYRDSVLEPWRKAPTVFRR